MITNIDIDATVVAEASRPSVRELFGIGGVDPDYDPKAGPDDSKIKRLPDRGDGARAGRGAGS